MIDVVIADIAVPTNVLILIFLFPLHRYMVPSLHQTAPSTGGVRAADGPARSSYTKRCIVVSLLRLAKFIAQHAEVH